MTQSRGYFPLSNRIMVLVTSSAIVIGLLFALVQDIRKGDLNAVNLFLFVVFFGLGCLGVWLSLFWKNRSLIGALIGATIGVRKQSREQDQGTRLTTPQIAVGNHEQNRPVASRDSVPRRTGFTGPREDTPVKKPRITRRRRRKQ